MFNTDGWYLYLKLKFNFCLLVFNVHIKIELLNAQEWTSLAAACLQKVQSLQERNLNFRHLNSKRLA